MIEFCKRIIKRPVETFLAYRDFGKIRRLHDRRFKMKWKERFIIQPYSPLNSSYDKHYIYHTAWAARILKKIKPSLHVDISSSLYFVSIISAFIPVSFYDFKPPNLLLSNLKCAFENLTKLSFSNASIESLSCMHVVEHIGLGRYGDQIDPFGDIKAMEELSRVLKSGGNLLFVVPIGREPKIVFNAHRIYDKDYIIRTFADLGMNLEEFTLIQNSSDKTGLITNPEESDMDGEEYACGCFWFKKKTS